MRRPGAGAAETERGSEAAISQVTVGSKRIITALLLAGMAATTGLGQSHLSKWRSYQASDGLMTNLCLQLSQGKNGKIWVTHGPQGGISGLDGYHITHYPAPPDLIGRVEESPRGQLWAVSQDGLQEYQNDKWTSYQVSEIAERLKTESNSPGAVPLFPVRTGHVLFMLPTQLMEFSINESGEKKVLPIWPASQSRLGVFLGMAVSTRDGSVWLSGQHGLAQATRPVQALVADNENPGNEWSQYVLPPELRVEDLREPIPDGDGGITMVATSVETHQAAVVHFDGVEQWEIRAVGGENIQRAWRGPDKQYWVMTRDALYSLDTGNQGGLNEEELARQYFDVAVEPGGLFWVATSEGLYRYSPAAWTTPPVAERESSAPVRAMVRDNANRLWLLQPNSLVMFGNGQMVRHPLPGAAENAVNSARALYSLADGLIVIGGADSSVRFDPNSLKFEEIETPEHQKVRALGMLGDGTLCVEVLNASTRPTEPRQLKVYDGRELRQPAFPPPPATIGNERMLSVSPDGTLWLIGTRSLARYQGQRWQIYGPLDDRPPEKISSFAEVSQGRLWFATKDGIIECDGKFWKPLVPGPANAILPGRDSSVWAATDNGVYRFFRGAWIQNGVGEGLPSEEVSGICEDSSGRIWAGTSKGLSQYHADADPDPPRTSAQSAASTSTVFPEGGRVVLTLGGSDKWKFTPASRLLYSYQIDTNDWTYYKESRTVSLDQLATGEHYFQARCIDRNWNVDPNPYSFSFTVELPWYKEARLLLVTSAGLVIIALLAGLAINRHLRLLRSHAEIEAQVALRTRQLELANQELLHSQKMHALGTLAAGIAHDFNSILSIIKGSAQIIEDNLDNPDKVRVRANRINMVVEQGAGIVKAMLGFSRGSGGEVVMCDINTVIGQTIKLLGDRFLREVEVQFKPLDGLPKAPASPDFVQQILLNLIFNAAEAMTTGRQIILGAEATSKLPPALVLAPAESSQYILVSVKDAGCGIPPEILPRIFEPFFTTKSLSARRGTGLGLSMVYELAGQLKAGLAVSSAVNQGSTFTLILPVRELPVDDKEKRA